MPSIVLNNVKYSGLSIGKNVTVSKIEPIVGGNRVTFSYYDGNNKQQSQSIEVMNGTNGTSIASAIIEDGNKLVITLSNGEVMNVGRITIDPSTIDMSSHYYTIDETNSRFVTRNEIATIIEETIDDQMTSTKDIESLF